MLIWLPQAGHLLCLPARLSGTFKFFRHWAQVILIASAVPPENSIRLSDSLSWPHALASMGTVYIMATDFEQGKAEGSRL